jgi:DNA-binding NtrC family response regulator
VHLLTRIAGELHKDVRLISDDVMRLLVAYDWPGNVRELDNALTRAAVLARGPAITPEHLSLTTPTSASAGVDAAPAADQTLEAVTRAHVERVLAQTGGNKRQAARILGISRPRLDRILAGDRTASERD